MRPGVVCLLGATLAACTPKDGVEPDETGYANLTWGLPSLSAAPDVVSDGLGRGATVADLDDGLLDLLLVTRYPATGAQSTVNAWRGLGDGGFEPATTAWGLVREDAGWGSMPLDLDHDGDLDLFTTRNGWNGPGANTVERRDADGFTEDPAPAPPCGEGASMGVSAADADLDGDLDLLVASGSPDETGGCVELYWSEGDELVPAADIGGGQHDGFGAAMADLDGDLYPELVVVGTSGAAVYQNLGEPPYFALDDVSRRVKLPVVGADFGLTDALLDYDQDGDLDVFVCAWGDPTSTEVTAYQALYRNDGDLVFTDVGPDLGVEGAKGCMGIGAGDLDANGWPDLHLGTGGPKDGMDTPNVLYMNDRGTFVDASAEAGLDGPHRTHGTVLVDLEGDGDCDLVLNHGGGNSGQEEPPEVLLADGSPFPSLRVALEGTAAIPWGSGARIAVHTDDGTRYAWAQHGDGFASIGMGPIFVGLGPATDISDVEVRFSDGEVVRTGPLPLDQGLVAVAHPDAP